MSDLIDKHFREDLTESEDQALLDTLETSNEAAQRYGEMAERAYVRYGLPEPGLPPPGGTVRVWLKWLALGAVLTAAGLGWYFRVHCAREGSPSPSVPMEVPHKIAPADPAPAGAVGVPHPAGKTADISRAGAPSRGSGRISRLDGEESSSTPPRVGTPQRRPFKSVNVVVTQPNPGPVTVRVLTEGRVEMRRLYDSDLPAGEWTFKWDGKLPDGKAAQPGLYLIEVKGFGESEVWEVRIR